MNEVLPHSEPHSPSANPKSFFLSVKCKLCPSHAATKSITATTFCYHEVVMDRSWMNANQFSEEYKKEVEEFIRRRVEMVQACNEYHHIVSRGGYELIEDKMMQDEIKQRQKSAGDSLPTPPSSPKRYEKWIRGRKSICIRRIN
ncbi:TNP1, partial [Trifolium pratense]